MRETFTIERLGHMGDGIAPGPFYAPRTLPGEEISAEATGTQLHDIRIVTPSPDRVAPPCRHYKGCGGCQLQHASEPFVAAWKQEVVQTALAAQGLETTWRPMHVSPPLSRRRATIAVRRTKKGALAGFHGRASDSIVEIPGCRLLDPGLLVALPLAEALAAVGASRKGEMSLTATTTANGLDVLVTGGKAIDASLRMQIAHMAERFHLARLTWEDEVIALRAPPVQVFGTARVVPPPGAFLQATPQGEAALLRAVKEITAEALRIADLFSGCGTFALPLAARAEVHGVEGEAAMVRALDKAWRQADGLKRVTTEARDLFRRPLMPDELKRFDAVVIDPPRAGAEAQVTELARSAVPVIAYVSCNPVTFAHDAKLLADAGFCLDWVHVIDQFRWSTHVELAAAFRRR